MQRDSNLKINWENSALVDNRQVGFAAQELELVLPGLINESFMPHDDPENGLELGPGVHFKAVNYIGLIPYMVSAMQQQQQTIEAQNRSLQDKQDQLNIMSDKIRDLELRLEKIEVGLN